MMGTTYADLTLSNATDVGMVECGLIKESEVRTVTVHAVVDTGADTLVITESVRDKLGLKVKRLFEATFANNTKEISQVAEPVEIQWADRSTTIEPWVVSGEGEVLLGALPLEGMDLIVDPCGETLVGKHGSTIRGMIY
jgi:clan AA aspartic protease